MTIPLTEILRPRPIAEIRDAMLASLGGLGFPVTSWRSGGVARTLVELTAEGVGQAWTLASAVARGSLLDLATGDWLTALALSHFQLPRVTATYTRGFVRLTAAAGVGPYNIPAAALVVSDGTRYYRSTNSTTYVVPSGGSVNVPVRAEGPGSVYNAPSLTILVSPALPGVTLTTPPVAPSSSWRTSEARDEESDAELRRRCKDRWATLASGFTRDAVRYWCTTATFADGTSAGCTRVGFAPPPGDGSYVVYVAGATGALGSLGTARVQVVLLEHCPMTDAPQVTDAIELMVAVSGTVRVLSGYDTTENRDAILASIDALFAARDIGDSSGLDIAAIHAAIYRSGAGVVDVDLSAPTGDTAIPMGRVVRCDPAALLLSV